MRIIAATHQHLENLVKQGKFREDLFYRLNVIRLTLPALRERRDDIPLLVNFFMQSIAKSMHLPAKIIAPDTMQVLQAFDWQGNVRQLENACRWLTVMASGQQVQVADLPPEILAFYHAKNMQQHPVSSQPTTEALLADGRENLTKNLPITAITASAPLAPTPQLPLNEDDWLTPLARWAKHALATGENQILQTASLDFERCLLQVALAHTGNHKGKSADLLGWGRNTVTRKFQQLLDEPHLNA